MLRSNSGLEKFSKLSKLSKDCISIQVFMLCCHSLIDMGLYLAKDTGNYATRNTISRYQWKSSKQMKLKKKDFIIKCKIKHWNAFHIYIISINMDESLQFAKKIKLWYSSMYFYIYKDLRKREENNIFINRTYMSSLCKVTYNTFTLYFYYTLI